MVSCIFTERHYTSRGLLLQYSLLLASFSVALMLSFKTAEYVVKLYNFITQIIQVSSKNIATKFRWGFSMTV